MESSKNLQAEVEREVEQLIPLVTSGAKLSETKKKVFSFLYKYSAYCFELIERKEFKSCLYILLKLQTLCLTVLQKSPEVEKSGLKKVASSISEVFVQYQKEPNSVNLRIGDFFNLISKQTKQLNLGSELSETTQYLTEVIFVLAMTLNNIGAIYKIREKIDRAVLNFMLCIEVMMAFGSHLDAFQTYSFITAIANFTACIQNDPEKLEDISQMIASSILFLEELETQVQATGAKANEHYSKLAFYSQFIFVQQLIAENYTKLSDYTIVKFL